MDDRGWPDGDKRAGELSFQLSNRFAAKVSPDTIRRWNTIKHTPRAETVYLLAELLEVDPDYLFGRDQIAERYRLSVRSCVGSVSADEAQMDIRPRPGRGRRGERAE
jgi:transcriptional regulator with XRE-family HTH domain